MSFPSDENGASPPSAPSARSALHRSRDAADIAWSQAPRLVASGLCMGTADMVPGVSGGTLAVALGIYRQLLAAIASIGLPAVKALAKGNVREVLAQVHWRFIASLGAGIVAAVVVMGKVVKLHELVRTSPQPVYSVFFGLVVASALLLGRKLGKFDAAIAFFLAAGTALGYAIVTLVPTQTPEHPVFVFAVGAIAICAMILPGISGSFILLILGKYELVINSLLTLDLSIAAPFALGCAVGISLFSRALGYALDRYHDPMLAGLTGLLVGSLWRIWPYQEVHMELVRGKMRPMDSVAYWPSSLDLSVVALAVTGFALVLGIEWLAKARSTQASTASASPSRG